LNRLLHQAVKQLAAGFGMPLVEAKRKFIQVVIQMFRGDRALMRPQQPEFEQSGHPMDPGKHFGGGVFIQAL
jgi:hypothetical protein